MRLWIYSILLHIVAPLVVLKLLWRSRKNKGYRQRMAERFALAFPANRSGGIWLHCVSVGETLGAVPVARRLLKDYPKLPLIITTTTPTGSEQVVNIFGNSVDHQYSPYDLGWVVRRFIRRVQPRAIVIMETELWPNLIAEAHRQQIPLIVINARMSEKSRRGYAKFMSLTRRMMSQVTAIGIQFESDADRFKALGLTESQLAVTGNIKFDTQPPASLGIAARQLRIQLGATRPILIAASTHKGEDEQIIKAFAQLLVSHPSVLLILVPRHPERFAPVMGLVQEAGFEVVRRTRIDKTLDQNVQVVVGDTMGELMLLYAASDGAFVGGSLIEHGGHNPLEPASLAKPVCFGPGCHNFEDICHRLVACGGAVWVDGPTMLAKVWKNWLDDPRQATQSGHAAREFQQKNQGALERTMKLLRQHI